MAAKRNPMNIARAPTAPAGRGTSPRNSASAATARGIVSESPTVVNMALVTWIARAHSRSDKTLSTSPLMSAAARRACAWSPPAQTAGICALWVPSPALQFIIALLHYQRGIEWSPPPPLSSLCCKLHLAPWNVKLLSRGYSYIVLWPTVSGWSKFRPEKRQKKGAS